jgi:hypothetical protein
LGVKLATAILLYAQAVDADFSAGQAAAYLCRNETPAPTVAEVTRALDELRRKRLLRVIGSDRFRLTDQGRRSLAPRPDAGTTRSFQFSPEHDFSLDEFIFKGFSNSIASGTRVAGRSEPKVVLPDRQGTTAGSSLAGGITAYARIEMDSDVRADTEVALVVGIARNAQANVVGEPLRIRDSYPFQLRITVAADRFTLRNGELWTTTVEATEHDPFPSVTLHVTPEPLEGTGPEQRVVVVFYSVEARTLGFGSVTVTVHSAEAALRAPDDAVPAGAVMTTFAAAAEVPDLTIRVATYEDGSGRLAWSFESPHFLAPGEPFVKRIGTSPAEFVAGLIRQVDALGATDDETRTTTMMGIGDQIRQAMPDGFDGVWRLLREKICAPRIPSVLILSDESYVPWELARVDQASDGTVFSFDLFDVAAPSLLGAQTEIARWILSKSGRPPLPPPSGLDLRPMVEVTARYTGPRTPKLEHAEQEGEVLRDRYDAEHVDALTKSIIGCMSKGDPRARTIHIALHGTWSSKDPVQGLIMVDNGVLSPTTVRGISAPERPFVFLNACQVGEGNEVLGQYAGLPAAFLYARARGVIAPLWSIDDAIAKEIAMRFYERLSLGDTPAAILREERKRFATEPISTTYLAYIYYGAPSSRFTP